MSKIWTIVSKEWAEVFKNRLVLFTVAFLPLVFIALPVATLLSIGDLGGESAELAEFVQGCPDQPNLSAAECGQTYFLDIFTLLFMILPVAIPVTIAAYSIVGEKTTRSLEPLLATPITTAELLAGKALAAMIPALAATWLAYLIYATIAYTLVPAPVAARLLSPLWLLAVFGLGPLLTLFTVNVALMISSRVSDPRVAEQLASVVVVPMILFLVGQSLGLFLINQRLVIIVGLILLVIDVGMVYLALQVFQRETILTRWR